jgi:hypothetical protein
MPGYTWNQLSENANKRRRFNPADTKDLKELSYFKKHGTWKSGCPFYIEWPFNDVVSMCYSKYTDFMLAKLTK